MRFRVDWIDFKREPKCTPDPRYPYGKELRCGGNGPACYCELPYPAERCGMYLVTCEICHIRIGVTTAGRPDDPRSVRVECKKKRADVGGEPARSATH